MQTAAKHVNCAICDMACQLKAIPDGNGKYRFEGDYANPIAPGAICTKAKQANEIYDHPNRLLKPLKRIGQRGAGEWEEIGWDQAMDEIAEKLQSIIDRYGPESFAASMSHHNVSVDNGMSRRLMNLLGSPNWISPAALCAGNTAAINRITCGWYPFSDLENTRCILLFGHNPHNNSWVQEYIRIRLALERGAKLIVLDPRKSQIAMKADVHLPLRPGTDAAMAYGFVSTILEEELYDRKFVENWTVGFEELKERCQREYSVSQVAQITGVETSLIRKAARIYAGASGASIPWSPITDQQVSSTSAIRLQTILRAITGNLDAPGGDLLMGPNADIVAESELESHERISPQQKAKQLGADSHPAFTYRAADLLADASERVWGMRYPNQVKGICMANPSATFRAMADGDPYPVKAFFSLGNNTLFSYANQPLIHRALMNQELLVSHELFMTPTARLADYVLPGDTWMERPNMHDSFEWTSTVQVSQQLADPPPECKSAFALWRDLAHRLGHGEAFPWPTLTDLFDERLRPLGLSWEGFQAKYKMLIPEAEYRKYRKAGFATPSGKVELRSSVLEDLGFDPLPYYREAPAVSDRFPLSLFVGIREPHYFQTGQRHVASLRKHHPDPLLFMSPADAETYGVTDKRWAEIETVNGKIAMKVKIRKDMPVGVVRVPHGWWLPEREDLGAWEHSDAVIFPDGEEYLDREQGIPHLRGIPCNVSAQKGNEANL